jgi:hypothetical protein
MDRRRETRPWSRWGQASEHACSLADAPETSCWERQLMGYEGSILAPFWKIPKSPEH